MNERRRFLSAVLTIGAAATFSGVCAAADDAWLWGAPGARTTYSAPYDPNDAPQIPLLKRSATATGGGAGSDAAKKNVETSGGPRVGDSGTFVGTDGKTYYYRFVEGVRRRAIVETRPDPSSPSGWRKIWRYVDEPRLIKQIWPAETSTAPEPCRPVENVVETSENNGASASLNEPPILYRATVRAVVP